MGGGEEEGVIKPPHLETARIPFPPAYLPGATAGINRGTETATTRQRETSVYSTPGVYLGPRCWTADLAFSDPRPLSGLLRDTIPLGVTLS